MQCDDNSMQTLQRNNKFSDFKGFIPTNENLI